MLWHTLLKEWNRLACSGWARPWSYLSGPLSGAVPSPADQWRMRETTCTGNDRRYNMTTTSKTPRLFINPAIPILLIYLPVAISWWRLWAYVRWWKVWFWLALPTFRCWRAVQLQRWQISEWYVIAHVRFGSKQRHLKGHHFLWYSVFTLLLPASEGMQIQIG